MATMTNETVRRDLERKLMTETVTKYGFIFRLSFSGFNTVPDLRYFLTVLWEQVYRSGYYCIN